MTGCDTFDQFLDLALVVGVVERPEERHRDGFDVFAVDQKPDRRFGGRFVELLKDRALVVGALGHADDAIGRHQRRRALGLDRMFDAVLGETAPAAIGAARHQDGVLKAARGDQAGPRAVARQDDVIDYGRAVHEQRGLRQQVRKRNTHRIGCRADGVDHADGKIRRRRERLAEMRGFSCGKHDGVGAGAADVGRHHVFAFYVAHRQLAY